MAEHFKINRISPCLATMAFEFARSILGIEGKTVARIAKGTAVAFARAYLVAKMFFEISLEVYLRFDQVKVLWMGRRVVHGLFTIYFIWRHRENTWETSFENAIREPGSKRTSNARFCTFLPFIEIFRFNIQFFH